MIQDVYLGSRIRILIVYPSRIRIRNTVSKLVMTKEYLLNKTKENGPLGYRLKKENKVYRYSR
jgi:hypothetical protein